MGSLSGWGEAILFSLAFVVDKEERSNLWKPILLFLDIPLAIATGMYYIGNTLFSIGWWTGLFMFLFACMLSFGGLYYSLKFGRR